MLVSELNQIVSHAASGRREVSTASTAQNFLQHMQTHGTGAIKGTRPGSYVTQQSVKLTSALNLSGVPVKLFTIVASVAQPVYMRLTGIILTPFVNGVNPSTLSVGTTSGGTQLLNAVDMKLAADTGYGTTPAQRLFTADTDIWAVRTDTTTAATAGEAVIVADLAEINVQPPQSPG